MRSRALVALLVASALVAPPASALVAPPAPVAASTVPLLPDGRWLVDPEGRKVLLHGVNVVYKLPPYAPSVTEADGFTQADADLLEDLGFNAVRLGSLFVGVSPNAPAEIDTGYLDRIGGIVDMLWERGIHTLLDAHQDMYNERFQGEGFPDWAVVDDGLPAQPKTGFPGNYVLMPAQNRAWDHFWTNEVQDTGIQDGLAAAWRALADRFSDHPGVLGYDVLNEPWPGSAWPGCASPAGCPAFDRLVLQAMQERVEDTIREVDDDRAVFFEPLLTFGLGADTGLWLEGDTTPGRGLSWHVYCGMQMGAQRFGYRFNAGCDEADGHVFDTAEQTASRGQAVNLNTEFGATDDPVALRRIVELADEHLVGWFYWQYKDFDDPTTGGPGEQSLFAHDADLTTLKDEKADILVRPYARAVAGAPTEMAFDPQTHVFSLRYSPDPAVGAPTEIFVPPRHYPCGYEVTSNASWVPRSGRAPLLRVRASGAETMTLTITPAEPCT